MKRRSDQAARDRGFRMVRLVTLGGVGSAVGLTGFFSTAAALTFSGNQVATHRDVAPLVPIEAAPVQQAPPAPIVIEQEVHHPAAYTGSYATGSGAAALPRPPSQGPAPAPPPAQGPAPPPPPPPPPVCHSTPSHPC
jgi:hypothetical protein